jgi:hypothetical protein
MIKIIFALMFFLNIAACEPISVVSNKKTNQQLSPFVCLSSQSQCDIQTDYGNFNLRFSQDMQEEGKIKTELPFQLKLSFEPLNESSQIKNISSYLEGKTMFMGKIPIFFQEQSTNIMVAESLLANCSEDVMTWQLWIQIEVLVDEKIQQQDFFLYFDSQRL